MDFLPSSILTLIEELSRLPGIGPKSAQRLAFHLLKNSGTRIQELGQAVLNVKEGVQTCNTCYMLTTQDPCVLCADERRNRGLLCVVESTLDLIAIEKTGEYKGLYHVLQGRLSPLDGVGVNEIRLGELFMRITEPTGEAPREIILALNPDLEGDTTALFIQKKLAALSPVQISRIARGIPSGALLEYTDDATLIRAMEGRQKFG